MTSQMFIIFLYTQSMYIAAKQKQCLNGHLFSIAVNRHNNVHLRVTFALAKQGSITTFKVQRLK